MKKLKDFRYKLPHNVNYYELDFNKQNLTDLAIQYNLNFDVPTTIIWEGVTNYLTPKAVNQTFEFFQKFVNRIYIIFAYIDQLVLSNPKSFRETENLFKNLKKNKEKWTFGLKLHHYLNI